MFEPLSISARVTIALLCEISMLAKLGNEKASRYQNQINHSNDGGMAKLLSASYSS